MSFRAHHLLAALGLHGLLFLMLAVGVRCTPVAVPPAVIQGVLLDPSRDQTARRDKALAQQKRAAEQERLKQEQIKKEVEREEARVEEQRKQEELKKVEQENQKLEEKKKEDQAKKKIEQEKKLKEEKKKARQLELEKAEQDLRRQQMEAESAEVESKQQQRQAQVAFDNWAGLVAEQVRRNWLRPPDSNELFECIVRIEQLPGGQIMSRKMVQSCGNKLLDESVLKAVDKSNPLPLVADPAAFQRSFTFKFVPK